MSRQLSAIEQRIQWTHFTRQTDKDVLMAMARWFCWRADGRQVRFKVKELARKAGVSKRSTERALERLEAAWWIDVTLRRQGSRQPTTYRLVLERLATVDPEALTPARVADEGARHPPEWRMNEGHIRHFGGCTTATVAKTLNDFEKVADQSTEEAVRTERSVPAASSEDIRHSGGCRPEHPDVPAFLAWAVVTYPEHAHGAHLVLDRDRDGHLVSGLLEHYPLERLQAMTVVCWTIEADRDLTSQASWIARSDRSLRVLRHKAAFLERVVVGAQQLTLGPVDDGFSRDEIKDAERALIFVYGRCPHEPVHTTHKECVREIALARRVG